MRIDTEEERDNFIIELTSYQVGFGMKVMSLLGLFPESAHSWRYFNYGNYKNVLMQHTENKIRRGISHLIGNILWVSIVRLIKSRKVQ